MANEFKIRKGLIVEGATSGTVVDVQGSLGQLFSVTDNLTGEIFAVADISGVPIMTINSSSATVFTGLVSGITPVVAANFVTKAYVDSGGGTNPGPWLPLSATSSFPLTGDLYIDQTSLYFLNAANDSWNIQNNSSGKLVFKSDTTQRGIWSSGELELANDLIVNGSVGIGMTTTPQAPLHVDPATTNEIAIAINGTQNYSAGQFHRIAAGDANSLNRLAIGFGYDDPTDWAIRYSSYGRHEFYTGNDWGNAANTEKMVITSTGNVGIGDPSPQGKLEVNNRNTATGAALFIKGGEDDLSPIAGQYTGLAFGYGGGDIYNNGAVLWEFTNTAANGKLHFAVNSTAGDGTANLTDSKMTILDSGDVGIGITSPGAKLQIASSTNADGILLTGDGSASGMGTGQGRSIDFQYTKTDSSFGSALRFAIPNDTVHGGALTFHTDDTVGTLQQAMLINNAQNVGINSTNPGQKLAIEGDGTANENVLRVNNQGQVSTRIWIRNAGQSAYIINSGTTADTLAAGLLPQALAMGIGNNSAVQFYNGLTPSAKMTIDSSGKVGIGTTTPSAKLDVQGSLGQLFSVTDNFSGEIFAVADISGVPLLSVNSTGVSYFNGPGTKLGIGTTSPDETLTVNGIIRAVDQLYFGAINLVNVTYGPFIESYDDKGLKFDFNGNSGGEFQIWNHDQNGGGATEVFTIEQDNDIFMPAGNVSIGKTTAALGRLDVSGTLAMSVGTTKRFQTFYSGGFTFINGGASGGTIYLGAPATYTQNFRVQGTGIFNSTCTATNFILSSDKTLKENIKDIDDKHINVSWKNFELKTEPGVKRSGVIAQELEINHPEFVRTDEEGLKSVAYIDLLIAKIAELEARLEKAGI